MMAGCRRRLPNRATSLQKLTGCRWKGRPTRQRWNTCGGGVRLRDFTTQPARVRPIAEPSDLWPRDPPIRYRAAIPTSWLEVIISEGKNRQVRRMCAAVGYPVLRLVRAAIGQASVTGLAPGEWRVLEGDIGLLRGRKT